MKKFRFTQEAEPFYMKGGKIGLLLLHGFTSTPQELRNLGEYFADRGYTVYAPMLAGHGTSKKDLVNRKWHEWVKDTQFGYNLLNKECDRIFIFGSSYGAILGIYAAAHNKVEGVISMGAPFRLFAPKRVVDFMLPFVRMNTKYIRKPIVGDIRDKNALKRRVAYMHVPVKAFGQVWKHTKITERMLKDFTTPILLLQSKRDHVTHPISARVVYNKVASKIKEVRFFRDSYHLITEDYEKEVAYEIIENFMNKVLKSKKEEKDEIRSSRSHTIF